MDTIQKPVQTKGKKPSTLFLIDAPKLIFCAILLTLVYSQLTGCADYHKFGLLQLDDSHDVIVSKVGDPAYMLTLGSVSYYLWCTRDSFSSSAVYVGRLLNGKLINLHSETLVHSGDCEMFLKAIACKMSELDRLEAFHCLWMDGERFE